MHHPKISELQKNFGGTQKQGSPKNQNFTAGLFYYLTLSSFYILCSVFLLYFDDDDINSTVRARAVLIDLPLPYPTRLVKPLFLPSVFLLPCLSCDLSLPSSLLSLFFPAFLPPALKRPPEILLRRPWERCKLPQSGQKLAASYNGFFMGIKRKHFVA